MYHRILAVFMSLSTDLPSTGVFFYCLFIYKIKISKILPTSVSFYFI